MSECGCPGCVRERYARALAESALKSWARVRKRGWAREVLELDRVERAMRRLSTTLATERCRAR